MNNSNSSYKDIVVKQQKSLKSFIDTLTTIPGLNVEEKKEIEYNLNEHKKFIENPDLQIAIVGAIKAGKSTLINALLGEDIASTEVTPETASLTKFRYSEKNYLKIKFYTKKEWEILWKSVIAKKNNNVFKDEYEKLGAENLKDEYLDKKDIIESFNNIEDLKQNVKKFSSSKSADHYFVKEIEIGMSQFNLPKEVCFVDTPGLNDVVPYRSKITTDYIRRANAVIVCVNADSMRNDEYVTIVKVFENVGKHQDKVFILGTQIDKLNNPIDDWEKQKTEWEKYLRPVYKDVKLLRENIFGVSSYCYHINNKLKNDLNYTDNEFIDLTNFAKKTGVISSENKKNIFTKIKEAVFDDEKSIIKNEYETIVEKTNINKFLSAINKKIAANIENIIFEDIKYRWEKIKNNLSETLSRMIAINNESLEALDMDIEKLEEKKLELETNINENLMVQENTDKLIVELKESIFSEFKSGEKEILDEFKNMKF